MNASSSDKKQFVEQDKASQAESWHVDGAERAWYVQ
jgi:hypothetical protein